MKILNLTEASEPDVYDFVANIKRDCQPYLQQVDNQPFTRYPLYRGISGSGGRLMFKKGVRLIDRTPAASSDDTHKMLNNRFTELYGEPFRNAMFATGSERKTWTYGLPFQIFPIGEFTFLWSPTVGDLWAQLEIVKYQSLDLVDKLIESYQTVDLKSASLSNKEVMIRCKNYYAMSYEKLLLPAPAMPKRYEAKLQ